jgi:hypothetical protein
MSDFSIYNENKLISYCYPAAAAPAIKEALVHQKLSSISIAPRRIFLISTSVLALFGWSILLF